jgi:hypothetical protein
VAALDPGALRFAGAPLSQQQILQQLRDAQPLAVKPVGSTSTVFRARLRAPIEAAWKAQSQKRPHGPESEVAAYRVGRCLQLDNVPPAISRRVPLAELSRLLAPKYAARWPEIASRLIVGPGDTVQVAAIYWIPVLADVGIDKQAGLRTAGEWLRVGGALPDERRALARSLSIMLGFDYLTGNFDRWSGDNVAGDAAASMVYLRDNDQAFASPMGEALERLMRSRLDACERFSRSFYAAVRSLSRSCVQRELAQDPEGARLLSERQLDELLDRQKTLISHVQALIAQHGEAQVLIFE